MRRHAASTAPAAAPQGELSLHIERLVIDEALLGRGGLHGLQAALQQELGRLLQQPGAGIFNQGGAVPALAAPTIQHRGTLRPAELGRQVAGSVHRSLRAGP